MGGILFLILLFAFIYFFGEAIGQMVGGTIMLMIGAPLALLPVTLFLYILKLGIGFHLDFGQVMTFSILITGFIFFLLRKMNEINSDFFPKNLFDYDEINSKSIAQIIILGAVFFAILLVLHFGFHSKFPIAYAKWAFNGDEIVETSKVENLEASSDSANSLQQTADLKALQEQVNKEDEQNAKPSESHETNSVNDSYSTSAPKLEAVDESVEANVNQEEIQQNEAESTYDTNEEYLQQAPVKSVSTSDTSCSTSGYGPGNVATCGYLATSCTKTGYGPGNDVACGGLSTSCEKTGYGPGNRVACGGKSTSCEKTGYGPGNDVACGGLSTSCEKTGYGAGNRVACGGKSTSCEKTGYDKGNDVACGGLSTSCEKTGYGPGNDVACGGLSTSCESTGYSEGDKKSCGGLAD